MSLADAEDDTAGARGAVAPWRPARILLYFLAGAGIVSASAGLAARFMPVTNHAVLIIASLSPYLTAAAAVSALILLLTRRRLIAAVAVTLLAAAVGVQLPLFVGSNHTAGQTVSVRVLTANLSEGEAEPAALAAIMRGSADVVLFQELTPELLSGLDREGLDSDFPYRALDARRFAAGVGIMSRHPLARPRRIGGYQQGMISADIQVPKAASDATVATVHLSGPWPQPVEDWRREIAGLPDTLRDISARAGAGAVIVAGDFNATMDLAPFRRLLRDGFRDAAEQSGAGLTRTYPADAAFPPVIGIDHILTRNSWADGVRTVRIPGSDHLGVQANVHLPVAIAPAS